MLINTDGIPYIGINMSYSLFSQLKKYIGISILSKYSVYIIQLLMLMIYARIFSPEEFGVLAGIQVFFTFFFLLAEIGLTPAIINSKSISQDEANGLFTLTLICGLVFFIVFYIVSYFLNDFYKRTDYTQIGIPICFAILFVSLSTLPNAFLQREKKFALLALAESVAEIISLIFVMLSLYFWDKGVIVLSMKILCVSIFRFIIKYWLCAKTTVDRPRFGANIKIITKFIYCTKHQIGFSFINYFSRNLDNILVGKYLGLGSLGIYDQAYTIMKYPLMLLTYAMSPAIQPVLKDYRDDINLVADTHNRFVSLMMVLGIISGFFVYFCSSDIVIILLGEKWISVAKVLEILAFTIPVQIVMSSSGGFFWAMNRPDLLFKCTLFAAVVNIFSICYGIYKGSLADLAIALIFSFHINFFQAYWVMYRIVFMKTYIRFLKSLIPALIVLVVCIPFVLIRDFIHALIQNHFIIVAIVGLFLVSVLLLSIKARKIINWVYV